MRVLIQASVMDGSSPPSTPPALPAWVQAFEDAQAQVSQAARCLTEAAEPQVDLKPAAALVSRSLAVLYDAIDHRRDRLADVRQTRETLAEAIAALAGPSGDDPKLGQARALLGKARDTLAAPESHFASLPAEEPPAARDLMASQDQVSLHWVVRASLAPKIQVPGPPPPPPLELPPLDKPKNVEQLRETIAKVEQRATERREARADHAQAREEAQQERQGAGAQPISESPEGFASPIDPAISEYELTGRRTRELFEEVAMLGSQRTPQLGDQWRTIDFLEKRMFTAIDAVAALGPVALHAIEQLVSDSPAKDPAGGFAAAMVLGSFEGRDALAAAERTIRSLGAGDPEVARYAAEAYKLIPHPHLAQAMRTMLADQDEAYRHLALDVLAHRGLVSIEELVTCANDSSPAVAGVALTALALAAPSHPELPTLLIQSVALPELAPATWLAMALSSHPSAISAPAAALSGPDGEQAALAMALTADHAAAQQLTEQCTAAPTPGLTAAVGWAGASESVPELIELLRHGDEGVVTAAAYALDRITGAQLYEEVEIDPEEVIVPDGPTPDVGDLEPPPPLAKQVSDPRDEPSSGSPDTMSRPTTDPRRWHAYWRERGDAFKDGSRFRRGHGYTPVVSLWELDGWLLTAPERRFLQHELVVRTGHFVRFDPLDLVAVQEDALKTWEPIVQRSSSIPGSWSRPGRRSSS